MMDDFFTTELPQTTEFFRAEPEKNELLTPEEAAQLLKVTAEQVRMLIRKRQIAAINVGCGPRRPLYRITRQAMRDFVSQRFQPGPAVQPGQFSWRPPISDHFPNLW